jgi:predicted acetylornithine/succinylornithine family transaminase
MRNKSIFKKMEDIIKKTEKYVMHTYHRFPVCFDHGEGYYIYDIKCKRYIDFLAGIAVNALGYHVKPVIEAVDKQKEKLFHVSNLYYIKEQAELAELLVKNSCLDKVFFCNSGAEANEAAVKLARVYGGKKRPNIITMEGSFHGRTMTTLAATAQKKYHESFRPLPPGFVYVPFNDIAAAGKAMDDSVCALFIELVQGEGGMNVAEHNYVKKLKKLCEESGVLFCVDEIQSGMGRTGKLFAYEWYDIEPDIITLAKALGGGLPLGAMLAKEKVAQCFKSGMHATTFGGSPFCTKVAKAHLDFLLSSNIIDKVSKKGDYFKKGLQKLKRFPVVKDVRGVGLMLGMELDSNSDSLRNFVLRAMDAGFLLGVAGGNVIRFEPPLIIDYKSIDELLVFLERELAEM